MSDQTDILTRTLSRFGLATEEAEIYLHLLAKSNKSALEISRDLHFARTRVYRLLDKLEAKGLVTQKFDTLGLKFTASPYQQLELLLAEKQSDLEGLKHMLPEVFEELHHLSQASGAGSKVFYHHGVDGFKHVTWNSLRTKGLLRIYEVSESMTAFLPQEFSEKVRMELAHNHITVHQLTNLTHIGAHTKVREEVRLWSARHIPIKEVAIKSEILIYNDVTAMYHYLNNDLFCVEIENADLAVMQKQLFDFIWNHAKIMGKIGDFGEAKIER